MEFNWSDQGYYILQNLKPEIVDLFNLELEEIMSLTSKTIGGGDKNIDTFHFRNAIKCYTELILGIYNEDFNYSKMNIVLRISSKAFIKNIVCYPGRIHKDDLINLRSTYSFEEIFHLILLTSFLKSRTQLTYVSKCYDEIIKGIE